MQLGELLVLGVSEGRRLGTVRLQAAAQLVPPGEQPLGGLAQLVGASPGLRGGPVQGVGGVHQVGPAGLRVQPVEVGQPAQEYPGGAGRRGGQAGVGDPVGGAGVGRRDPLLGGGHAVHERAQLGHPARVPVPDRDQRAHPIAQGGHPGDDAVDPDLRAGRQPAAGRGGQRIAQIRPGRLGERVGQRFRVVGEAHRPGLRDQRVHLLGQRCVPAGHHRPRTVHIGQMAGDRGAAPFQLPGEVPQADPGGRCRRGALGRHPGRVEQDDRFAAHRPQRVPVGVVGAALPADAPGPLQQVTEDRELRPQPVHLRLERGPPGLGESGQAAATQVGQGGMAVDGEHRGGDAVVRGAEPGKGLVHGLPAHRCGHAASPGTWLAVRRPVRSPSATGR